MNLIRTAFTATIGLILNVTIHSQSYSNDKFVQIQSKTKFIEEVVGRSMTHENGHFVVNKNGTWAGLFSGQSLAGKWKWKNGFWCRTIENSNIKPDCQLWQSNGSELLLIRNKGKGKAMMVK
ncbi:MAG: hypothetical protein COC00_010350 [Rhizobiales bacterium]|nr:hypothetical protein [Hyphomicrobiales bacterium]